MIRMLSIPRRNNENRYFALMADALEREGVQVIDPTMTSVARFDYDILQINFPTHYITESGLLKAILTSVVFGCYLLLTRLLGRKIVYAVHDVVPFRLRHPILQTAFLRLVHRLTNGFIFLSASSREAFVASYPRDANTPWVYALHGPYPARLSTPAERLAAKRKIGGEAFLIGFLSAVKPYKNIEALRALPSHVSGGRPVHTLVAGQVEAGYERAVQAVLDDLPAGQVTRIDRRIDDAELDDLIQAMDVVVTPYVKGSNSGVALLVLSNEARLIGSDLPIFQELAETVGSPWVYSVSPGTEFAAAFASTVAAAAGDEVTEADRARLRDYLQTVSYGNGAAFVAGLCRQLTRAAAG